MLKIRRGFHSTWYLETMNLLVRSSGRLHRSLHLFLTTTSPYSVVSSKFSTSGCNGKPEAPAPPKPHFSATNYLIQSCGLSPQEALRASKKLDHLKSPDKPDAVLQFLKETGIADSDITKAVLRDALILRSSVEKIWEPNVGKLQEVGFSVEDISALISKQPCLFRFNIVSKIDFWMGALGSLVSLSVLVTRIPRVFGGCLEKARLNLSFLKEQLGLDNSQIVRLIKVAPYLITHSLQTLIIKAKEAEQLGVNRSSRTYAHALAVVSNLNTQTINARLNHLISCGFSQEEVTTLVSKHPYVLPLSEESIGPKIEFLIKEVGCDKSHVICNPALLTYGLDKRLIPRNLVKKLLELKGLLVANRKFFSFAKLTEERFVERFVLPYEHAIPGLHQAYADACAGNISGIEWFKIISS